MDLYGTLLITAFVASWNDSSRGRGVVVARIETTLAEAPEVFGKWQANNGHLGAKPGEYNSPFEAVFRPRSTPISDH